MPPTPGVELSFWLKFGGRDPHPPAFRGAPPPGPPKRRSAPLAAAVFSFLATEPLVLGSFAARGRFFLKNRTCFLKKQLVPGSFAAWGRTVFSKFRLCGRGHLSQAASQPGAELVLKNRTCFLKKQLVPGSFAAWGRTFIEIQTFWKEATCPGQLRCLGQSFFSQKSDLF